MQNEVENIIAYSFGQLARDLENDVPVDLDAQVRDTGIEIRCTPKGGGPWWIIKFDRYDNTNA